MSISVPKETIYMPCYHIDLSAKKATLGKYNYTEFLKKAAEHKDDGTVYYGEPDKYGRVFVDPAHPRKATFEYGDASGIPLPDPASTRMPAVNSKAEEKEKTRKKEERKDQEEQTRLLREERLQTARQEGAIRSFRVAAYWFDPETLTLRPDHNYFSDLLAKQSELAETGESQLTPQEIEALSGKCDLNKMSSQEYKDLVNYLADKGVIERPEPLGFDPGEPVYIKGGTAWIDTTGPTGLADGIVRYLIPELAQTHNWLFSGL